MLLCLIPFDRNASNFFLSFALSMVRFMDNIPCNGIFILIFRVKEYSVRRKMRSTQPKVFHPYEDGVSGEGSFLRLLKEAIRAAGRRRAELREVQAVLLAMGWHP
jgi:hypothetical protein